LRFSDPFVVSIFKKSLIGGKSAAMPRKFTFSIELTREVTFGAVRLQIRHGDAAHGPINRMNLSDKHACERPSPSVRHSDQSLTPRHLGESDAAQLRAETIDVPVAMPTMASSRIVREQFIGTASKEGQHISHQPHRSEHQGNPLSRCRQP
jgi:hypothetical protein